MSDTFGLVIPAFDPDLRQMVDYVCSLQETFENDIEIRIELDSPRKNIEQRLGDIPVTLNIASYRRGKGAAITDGWEAMDTDILAFADADGSTPAVEVKSILEDVATGGTDLSIGSRRHPDATVHTNQTYGRRYMGDTFAWLARTVLGMDIYDYQCGAKAISLEAWKKVRTDVHESGFAWDIELIAMANVHGFRINEVPIDWYDKPGSTVDPVRTSIDLLRALLSVRYRAKRIHGSFLYEIIGKAFKTSPPLVHRE